MLHHHANFVKFKWKMPSKSPNSAKNTHQEFLLSGDSLTQTKIFQILLVAFLLMARMLKFQKNLRILELPFDIQMSKHKEKAKDQKMH